MLFSPTLPEQGARGTCYEHAEDMQCLQSTGGGEGGGEGGKWRFLELPRPMAGS